MSLGLVIAEAAGRAGRYVSWFPSYGPEQRGGAASCSVVVSGREVGSPAIDHPDILVAMNQPSFEKFVPTVNSGGIVLYDSSIPVEVKAKRGVILYPFPAMRIAAENGVPKAANTALLGALVALNSLGVGEEHILSALDDSFAERPQLIEKNRKIFEAGKAFAEAELR